MTASPPAPARRHQSPAARSVVVRVPRDVVELLGQVAQQCGLRPSAIVSKLLEDGLGNRPAWLEHAIASHAKTQAPTATAQPADQPDAVEVAA